MLSYESGFMNITAVGKCFHFSLFCRLPRIAAYRLSPCVVTVMILVGSSLCWLTVPEDGSLLSKSSESWQALVYGSD